MENCLVTKLKSNVSADLPIFGEFDKVFINCNQLGLHLSAIKPLSVKCKIITDDVTFGITGGDAVKINDKEVYLGTSDSQVYFSEGTIGKTVELSIENYYDLNYFSVNSPLNDGDTSRLKYMTKLYALNLLNVTMTGNIGDLALPSLQSIYVQANSKMKIYLDGIEKFNNTALTSLTLRTFGDTKGTLNFNMLNSDKRNEITKIDIQYTKNSITNIEDFASMFKYLDRLNIADNQYNGQNFENVIKTFVSNGRTSGTLSLYAVRCGILFNGVSIDADGTESNMTWEPAGAGYTSVTWKGTTIQIQNS